MDFFERAHVPKKPDKAVKMQLKQMMNAYKKGNNQGIRNSSEIKPKFDMDETISIGEFSDFSATNDVDNTMDTVSSASDDLQSGSEDNSSKSNSEENIQDDSLEVSDDFKALKTSVDDSASTSFDNSLAVLEDLDSNDSDMSMPTSLQTTASPTDVSDDEFDADGHLASKILENLGKKDKSSIKRKIPKDSEVEIRKDVETKQKPEIKEKIQKKSKNPKETHNNSTQLFFEEEFSSDNDNEITNDWLHELKLNETKSKKTRKQTPNVEFIDESIISSLDSDDETKSKKTKKHKEKQTSTKVFLDESINDSLDSIDETKSKKTKKHKQKQTPTKDFIVESINDSMDSVDETISKKTKKQKQTSTKVFLDESINYSLDSIDETKSKKTKKHKQKQTPTKDFIVESINDSMDSVDETISNKTKKQKQTSTKIFLDESINDSLDSIDETKSKKTKKHKQTPTLDLIDDSINSLDSVSSNISSPFISISAEDMSNQSLNDVLGSYVHPTIKNLPSDKQNVIPTRIKLFPTEAMIVKDVIDDEISSLVPEVDEELDVEDLNIDTDTQELIEENNTLNNTIPTEDVDITEAILNEDITDTLPIDDTTIEDDVLEELPIKLYNGSNKYIIVMKHPAELYIHGKLQVADINGSVEIFGYNLNYDSVEVYAPYSNFALTIKTCLNRHATNPDLLSELTSAGVSISDANEIISNIEEHTSVIVLSTLYNRRLDFVANNFSTIDLFSKRVDNTPRFLKKAAEKLGCSFYVRPPKKRFEEKVIWEDVYSTGNGDKSRGIVCGGKGTGKSTFLRYHVNRLLNDGPVLVIDLDPGQAEFTVPGNLSATVVDRPLIGPNFTHLRTPDRMLNIGIINTMDNAIRYLSAVNELITYCRANEAYRELPWIVNTMGMCNNMGLKFITSIILQVQPTFLFQIDSRVPKRRFDLDLDPLTVTQLFEEYYSNDRSFRNVQNPYWFTTLKYSFVIARSEDTTPVRENSFGFRLRPRDERYLNILAYFGELLDNNSTKGLLEIVPYEVNLKDLNIGLNVKIPADSVTKVINGKIVALCQQSHDTSKVFTLGDMALLCHGHGLIRSIDLEQSILYILTPTPIGKLNSVDTLVYSDWMPELRGQERDLPSGTAIPYRTANTELHHRKLMFPPRRRFNPIQLLRMSRNT